MLFQLVLICLLVFEKLYQVLGLMMDGCSFFIAIFDNCGVKVIVRFSVIFVFHDHVY